MRSPDAQSCDVPSVCFVVGGNRPCATASDFAARLRRPGRRARRGAVMTEFAIVLPIFLLAIIGIIEFGRAVNVQQMLINAAREGAREAMSIDSTNADVLAVVNDYLDSVDSFVRDAPGRQVAIVDTDGNAIDLATAAKHTGVVVQVSVPYDEVGIGISSFFTDASIGAAVEMRKE